MANSRGSVKFLPPRLCIECGTGFRPYRSTAKICGGASCRRAARRRFHRKYREQNKGRIKVARVRRDNLAGVAAWAKTAVRNARTHSRSRRHPEPTISGLFLQDLFRRQGGVCYWSGCPLSLMTRSPFRVSVDRLQASRGYEEDNVVLCCWFMNRARSDLSCDDFRSVMLMVASHLPQRLCERVRGQAP